MADSQALWTFSDAIEHCLDVSNGTGTDPSERRKARRAVLDAYRDLPLRDDWTYLKRRGQVVLEASQSSGTVTFDLTGGANERMLTLSGATWPVNARYGAVIIDEEHYLIESRVSSTVVTLRFDSCPSADLAAGTTYEYYRNTYPVPLDFRMGTEPLIRDEGGRSVCYVPPHELLAMQGVNDNPQGWLQVYTIRGGGDDYNSMVFEFQPPPSEADVLTYLYDSAPRSLKLFSGEVEYTTGTISISGTTVTGTGTAFSQDMVGSVLRVPPSGVDQIPTGVAGTVTADYPYGEYRIITAVASATSATIDTAMDGTYSGVKFSIGSPLDIDYHCMLSALLAMCEWKFAIGIKSEQKVIEAKEAAFLREFGRARAADHRRPAETSERPLPRYWEMYT